MADIYTRMHRATLAQCPPCNGHCRQGRDCNARPTAAARSGSADPLGDDQAERHSGWGALLESEEAELAQRRTASTRTGWLLLAITLLGAFAGLAFYPR
jgi:hypothetical protein